MSGQKSMSEINALKRSRMSHIMEKLKQQSMTLGEILESLVKTKLINNKKSSKRSVQNYLAELRAIGVVSCSSGTYRLAEHERQVFKSKHDYQIAVAHSKHLFFSDERENTQRFDHTNPYLAIDLLVYEPERNADDFAILQHLKTGYPDIYANLQKYRRLMDETVLSKRTCLPKLGGGFDFDDDKCFLQQSVQPVLVASSKMIDDRVIEFQSGTLGVNDIIAKVPASKVKEILNLRDLLVGRVYGHLMNAVRNGIPLRGYCDFCPNKEITIK